MTEADVRKATIREVLKAIPVKCADAPCVTRCHRRIRKIVKEMLDE